MKKQCKMPVLVGLVAITFNCAIQAEERDRNGTVRGMFVRLIEQRIGEQEYIGIVLKPFERDDHVTVLVPRNREELVQIARKLDEDTRLEISFTNEDGHKFIKGIEAEVRRAKRQEGSEGEKQVIVRREVRRETPEGNERPENRRSRGARRELERPRERENRQDRRPTAQLDQLQRQLREVVSGHLDRMSRSLREVLADHLWRMDAEFRELRARVDRIERELDQLRAENERLRRELRKRNGPKGEREEPVQERKGDRERIERDVRRNREEM